MSKFPSTSKQNDGFEEDDIFDDSSFLAQLDNSFKQTSKFSENNINDDANKSSLNISALCCDEELSGYDKLTGKTWIYPTNYPVRDYQFNIIRAAIVKNTLVSLPTGLGKTFIAAVIMYNFYRWYPLGKIVFTAPTRPLVAQQIDACYNIVAIPRDDTVEMTGHMQVNTRKLHWQNKRVFFATPQVIYNDMKSGICPCDKIRCLVIDEAHKARGNYAYCQIISTLDDMKLKTYRVLALSATPGSKVEDVINVVKSLHIAHLELRTENCIDVAPYSHSRKINTVIIELGAQLSQLRHQYVEILDGYARRLKQLNILPNNLGNLSKGRIVMLYKEFQTKDRSARHPQHNYIMKDFTLLIALYHGLELLVQHGSRVFLNFFDEHPEKSWIQSDDRLTALLERLRDDLGINPLSLDRSILPDGTVPEMPKDLCFGHPKFDKLKEIITSHFMKAQEKKQDTRAIVFCEYRESVNLVHCLLLQCRPLVMPQMFVGQGASGKDGKTVVSQKQQLRVMRRFREGACNVLVATCVAEEGLDVGSVDLILCFDISTRSPIRLVQRCGRTGRERGGQVFILVTEGREHQTLMDCMRQRDGLNKKILQSKDVENNLYKSNPRLIPHGFMPECQKMHITVKKKIDLKEANKDASELSKKGQKDLRNMLLGKPSTSGTNKSRELIASIITTNEFNELFPDGYYETNYFRSPKEYWAMNKDTLKEPTINTPKEDDLNLSKWLEWQRRLQRTANVDHSKDSQILAELLQYGDAERFETAPPSRNPISAFTTQEVIQSITVKPPVELSPAKLKSPRKKQKVTVTKPSGKNGDIRALFSTATGSTKNYTKIINDLGIQNDASIPTRLLSLLVDLKLDNTNSTKTCYFCQNICNCTVMTNARKLKTVTAVVKATLKEPVLPNIDLIDDFDAAVVLNCIKNEKTDDYNISNIFDIDTDFLSTEEIKTPVKKYDYKPNVNNNFDLDIEFLSNEEKSPIEIKTVKYEINVPSNNFDIGDIIDIFSDSELEEDRESKAKIEKPKGDTVDIFSVSNPEKDTVKEVINVKTVCTEESKSGIKAEVPKETLGFFGLDSIDDIFADDEIDNTPPETTQSKKSKTNNGQRAEVLKSPVDFPVSPSILSGRQKPKDITTSPILGSQVRKFSLSTKKRIPKSSTPISSCRKQLLKEAINNNEVIADDAKPEKIIKDTTIDSTNKSMFTITQLVDMINKSDRDTSAINKTVLSKEIEAPAERSVSPILLTQADRNKYSLSMRRSSQKTPSVSTSKNNVRLTQTTRNESLIILDSDSDSDSTQLYDIADEIEKSCIHNKIADTTCSNQVGGKRKFETEDNDAITASPYFCKKQKLDTQNDNKKTLPEKILAALTSNKTKTSTHFKNDMTTMTCTTSPPRFSQKENENPQFLIDGRVKNSEMSPKKSKLSMLQMFKRETKLECVKSKFDMIFNKSPKVEELQKHVSVFDDSDDDDDFVNDKKSNRINQHSTNGNKHKSTTNHKVRKKQKTSEFLEMEAEISEDNDSGDELTDDSIGSIVDFIHDDNMTHDEDIHAVYLKSVKSPVKGGGFKIPELPKKYNQNILSQYVEEDAYEMDSFVVDSHIGLTQVNEVSELELAEMLLEEKRKAKKKIRHMCTQDDSPVLKKNKPKRRMISSDSEDE